MMFGFSNDLPKLEKYTTDIGTAYQNSMKLHQIDKQIKEFIDCHKECLDNACI